MPRAAITVCLTCQLFVDYAMNQGASAYLCPRMQLRAIAQRLATVFAATL